MTWTILPLTGKYYGTKVVNDAYDQIVVWTGYDGTASHREIEAGWTVDDGYDHVESTKDYKYAVAIMNALNALENEQY